MKFLSFNLKYLKTCNVQQIPWHKYVPHRMLHTTTASTTILFEDVAANRVCISFLLSRIMNCQTWVSDFRLRHRPMQDLGLHVPNSCTVQNTRSVGPVMECNNRRMIVTCSVVVVLTLIMSAASLTLITLQLKYPQLLAGEINNKINYIAIAESDILCGV